jgi:Tryptophan-associated transmembrane protein (Trp_oprn_chp)
VRRERGYAATAAVAGAGLALLAASRAWSDSPGRPEPANLGTVADPLTGGEQYPWIAALALAALAGGGALLATRGTLRTAVGGLLLLCGAGVVLGGAYAVAQEAAPSWPIAAAVGGLAVFDAGYLTVRKGRSWPGMGARYEREAGRDDPASMWDDLDHGRDPTTR